MGIAGSSQEVHKLEDVRDGTIVAGVGAGGSNNWVSRYHKSTIACRRYLVLFHATNDSVRHLIMKNGYKVGNRSRLCDGVYFTPDIDMAEKYSIELHDAIEGGMLTAAIIDTKGKIADGGTANDLRSVTPSGRAQIGSRDWLYGDCGLAISQHPPWPGIGKTEPFPEVVVKNPADIYLLGTGAAVVKKSQCSRGSLPEIIEKAIEYHQMTLAFISQCCDRITLPNGVRVCGIKGCY